MTTLLARTQTPDTQAATTPTDALEMLREGNRRFVEGKLIERPWSEQVEATAEGQYPLAVVLGCIDSRVPVEKVFDQGIGDIFTARVAGNVVNEDLLGSMEFACKIAGSKAVIVLGHTSCGAVKGAIGNARLGNLTALVQKIEPAVESVRAEMDSDDPGFTDRVAEAHVGLVIESIRKQSPVLAEMESNGEIALQGAMYDIATGEVRFV
jgi:carbonic anhydrase